MKCKKAQKSLYDFLAQRLDKRASKEIQKHMDICMKCRDEMENLKKILFNIKKK